jgi:signal transduction histidine kinase/DNA-binding response OmpR family regulator
MSVRTKILVPDVESGTDATGELRRVEALKTSALQHAIFNSAYFSCIATDEKGVIQICNVGAERMLGYTAAEVKNKFTPADLSDPLELIARAQALSLELQTPITPGFAALVFKASHGIEDIYELTYIRKDGRRIPAIVSVTALSDDQDTIIGYLLIGTDNTARKEVEASKALLDQRLREKNIELEYASRMKSEFLATMSHELRTPLNAIIGFSEALMDGLMGRVSETQQEYITDIFSSGQHLLSLINDILDLSKVEAGKMTVDLDAVDIKGLLSNSLSIVKEKAGAHSIRLELEMDEGLGLSELDIRKTKQIIYNLLSNAVKFSARGGRVKLHARIVARAAVGTITGGWPVHGFPLPDNDHDTFLEILVKDQGIGIARENMARLFQAFSQIDSGLARKFEGTGLGLAMVRQLAELLGGTVAVAAAEGEGACFGAWLPVYAPIRATVPPPQRAAALAAATAMTPTHSAQRTALVVEDDDRAADLVRLQLEAEGFVVLRATSGESALAMEPPQPLSLITLDIELPGMNGLEFLTRIGENSALAQVPVVIISGLANGNLGPGSGAAAVLQKPISRVQLKASLATLGLQPAKERIHTVLVVDDDHIAVELIAKSLQAPDYAVVRAYCGNEAITLAHALKPDLILLDLMMPEMTGFEVVKVLQGNVETAAIPIVVVTAKLVTDLDRSQLNSAAGKVIAIVDKAGFDSERFIAEVRRSLPPNETRNYGG